jgi:uncharacterized membrane protein YccC
MSEAFTGRFGMGPGRELARAQTVLANVFDAAGAPLLFGIRLWLSVCLSLYIAFYLELEHAFWAGTTAAIVCQPQLGASLRKGWFRLIGTMIGAVWIVVLTALFPQDRIAFLVLLALWGGLGAYFATQLKNFASYAAALAGYTAIIVAADTLGATGGSSGHVFLPAVSRATEISIGIVSAGVVLAGTDLGRAPRQLAAAIASLAAEITSAFTHMLARAGTHMPDTQQERREFVRRAVALDPVVDQAIGESSELRYHSPILQSTVHGLFLAVDGWRTVGVHLKQLPDDEARRQAEKVFRSLPPDLRSILESPSHARWLTETVRLRASCARAIRTLLALPADTPSLRLLADKTAKMLTGILRVLDGLALLTGAPVRLHAEDRQFQLSSPDPLPALVNAVRAFFAIGAAALLWVVTAWPNGTSAMIFAAIVVLLFAPRGDVAPAGSIMFAIGAAIAIPCAAFVKFAVLPNFETFAGLSLVLGLYFIPVGFLVAQTWWTTPAFAFMAMAFQFVPILDPANEINYNTLQFYNAALALLIGCVIAALSFYLLPPLPAQLRAHRLLAFALKDLRRSAIGPVPPTLTDWEQRMYGRLSAMPDKAEPVQRSQLVAALTVGSEMLRLRRMAVLLALEPDLSAALAALAAGDSATATARLSQLDARLASCSGTEPEMHRALRARARILVITEALTQYAPYFDAGAPA